MSLFVVLAFAILGFSGLILYATPPGRIANWSGWTLLGATKISWQSVHAVIGISFVVAAAVHLWFNWRVILHYLRSKVASGVPGGRELAWAGAAIAILVGLTLADVPPLSFVADGREALAESWDTAETAPPAPHTELLSIAAVATALQRPVDGVIAALEGQGLHATPDSTLADVAAAHGRTPQQVYATLEADPAPLAAAAAELPGTGLGRKSLRLVASELGLTLAEAERRLRLAGIEPDPDVPLRDMAERAGRHAPELVTLMREPVQ